MTRLIGKQAAASVIVCLAGLFVCAPPGFAVPVPWLYDVDIAVEGRTAAARMAVSGAALAEVLSRVSGLAHVPRNATVRTALGRPETYYDRFVFLNDRELRIHFVPAAILNLADEAKLPVWSANRPPVLAWLVVESGGARQIVNGDHELAATLAERARQRGIILKLPLMDLEDRLLVRPSVIQGRIFGTLSEASRRYQADVILVGRLREQVCVLDLQGAVDLDAAQALDADANDAGVQQSPVETSSALGAAAALEPPAAIEPSQAPTPAVETPPAAILEGCESAGASVYAGSVEAWMNGEEFAADFTAPDVQEAVRMAADFVADELAGRFAVLARATNRIALTVGGIKSPIGYGRLLGYLDALEFVTAVDVVAVRGDRLEIALHTRAGLNQLVELLQKDGRIQRDPVDATLLTWQGP